MSPAGPLLSAVSAGVSARQLAIGCHPEQSEGSRRRQGLRPQGGFPLHLILRCAQSLPWAQRRDDSTKRPSARRRRGLDPIEAIEESTCTPSACTDPAAPSSSSTKR